MMGASNCGDVLRVAGGAAYWLCGSGDLYSSLALAKSSGAGEPHIPLYTETHLLAMYAAGQESAKADGWRQCAVGQRSSQFCGQLESAVAAERAISDKMERALKVARFYLDTGHHSHVTVIAALAELTAIRTLPTTQTKKGEQA